MLTFSQAVERGLTLVERQVHATSVDPAWPLYASSALFERVARAVLLADGERNPPRTLVAPLVEAMRERWDHMVATGEVRP